MKYALSDHSDGREFFNRERNQEPGFWEVLKMLTEMKYQKWPKFVENHPVLNLNSELSSAEVAITFINHASLLIQLPGFNVLTDPVWAERASPVSWAGPKRVRKPGIEFASLPPIDLVIISHNHYDHMDLATLKKLNQRFSPRIFVPLGNQSLLNTKGIHRVEEMDWWDAQTLNADTAITFTPTRHFSSRRIFDRNKTLWGSYMIQSAGHSIYFAGDSAYTTHFKEIHDRFGATDLSLLPIGAYEPQWFMSFFHMNPAEAVQAHHDLESRQSIGIHFGTFQLTEEGIDAPVRDLAAAMAHSGQDPESFVTLREGVTKVYGLGNGS